ncbi:MAG: hypothetical protein V3T58_00590, partial [Candidatus Hydrothermarchaeales archaeon]
NAGKAVIVLAKETGFRKEAAVGKQLLARDAFKFLDTIKEVEFTETFKRETEAEEGKKKAPKAKSKPKEKKTD